MNGLLEQTATQVRALGLRSIAKEHYFLKIVWFKYVTEAAKGREHVVKGRTLSQVGQDKGLEMVVKFMVVKKHLKISKHCFTLTVLQSLEWRAETLGIQRYLVHWPEDLKVS